MAVDYLEKLDDSLNEKLRTSYLTKSLPSPDGPVPSETPHESLLPVGPTRGHHWSCPPVWHRCLGACLLPPV